MSPRSKIAPRRETRPKRAEGLTDQALAFGDRLKEGIAKIGKAAGLGPLAESLANAEQEMIDRIVATARKHKVPEASIQQALALKKKADRASVLVWLAFPYVPSPELIRAIGKPDARTGDKSKRKRA